MRKRFEWQWEELDSHTRRAKVIGGWVVNSYLGKAESMVFVPDRDHEWHILPPPKDPSLG